MASIPQNCSKGCSKELLRRPLQELLKGLLQELLRELLKARGPRPTQKIHSDSPLGTLPLRHNDNCTSRVTCKFTNDRGQTGKGRIYPQKKGNSNLDKKRQVASQLPKFPSPNTERTVCFQEKQSIGAAASWTHSSGTMYTDFSKEE